jgi:hypothetical protein
MRQFKILFFHSSIQTHKLHSFPLKKYTDSAIALLPLIFVSIPIWEVTLPIFLHVGNSADTLHIKIGNCCIYRQLGRFYSTSRN